MSHVVRKGLDLPIHGQPVQSVSDSAPPDRVALLGHDYVGLRPRMRVQEGDRVAKGQPVFDDRTLDGVVFTAPGAGRVVAIHRGDKRAFISLVIELDEGEEDAVTFEAFSSDAGNTREAAQALLLESGLWTALRTRPFSRTPQPGSAPHSIFVTAVDSHPLAPAPELAVEGREADFERGLAVLARLTDGPVHLCVREGSPIGPGDAPAEVSAFDGKHPCGTAGYHIPVLDPVHRGKTVWHVGYPDVLRIGRLFDTGELDVTQLVALAGPMVRRPRVIRTRLGADTASIVAGELEGGECRVISGSVLDGHRAMEDRFGYLGRFARQVSVIREGRERVMLGWTLPGLERFSAIPTFLSSLIPKKTFSMTSTTNGSRRAMVPIGVYEQVMPMDIMPTHLLRAISVGDVEWAEELGVLELDEEDLGLCTFVCPSKNDYGPALRRTLESIRKEL